MSLDITKRSDEHGDHIVLRGRFDAHETDAVSAVLDECTSTGRCNLRLDLSDVNFVDSTALAAMTATMKRCREARGDLVIVDPSEPVRIILELTGLDKAFVIEESVAS